MTVSSFLPGHWLPTLKARIVLLAVLTGMLSAAGTAAVVLDDAQRSIQRVVLAAAKDDRERMAALLGSKVAVLRESLTAVAAQVPAAAWQEPAAMGRYLLEQQALGATFGAVVGADTTGRVLARVQGGRVGLENLPSLADRDFFTRAMASDQPVISGALMSRISQVPIVVIAVPVLDGDSRHLGLIAGSLMLRSTALFQGPIGLLQSDSARELIVDRDGMIVSHEDPERVMRSAQDEPGLRGVVQDWLAAGSPIDTLGVATVQGEHVVSIAGIPLTDWISVRVAPAAAAFAPVHEARATAWPAAAVAGLLAGVLAGAVAYRLTRPIARLQARAERLLDNSSDGASRWPDDAGEIGRLADAFRHVVEQRERRQTEAQALLAQLEAVLDHAEVGIALTRNGRFELVSRHFCLIFRCEKADVVGESTRMIYASDEAFAALVALARPALTEHGLLDTELELVRRSGQVFWARMRARAVIPGDVSGGTIWTIEDVTAAREHREHLAYTASHDALTGLVNRAAFERVLEDATAAAGREPFCALFIDLDRFKQVNDTGGHAAGDALLRDVARVLAAQVRGSDTVARLGGDEFAVLLPRCPPGQAHEIADRLCTAVQAYELVWEGRRFAVGASVGLVVVDAGFTSVADVLRAADSACYLAKKRGRSRVEAYEASVH